MTIKSMRRAYQVVKTVLQYGLDDLIPAKLKPWYFRLLRWSFFWLTNQHKDKVGGERLKLAMQELGPV